MARTILIKLKSLQQWWWAVIEYATHRGKRSAQEDRVIWEKMCDGVLLGVCDGHCGSEVSEILRNEVPRFWRAVDGENYEHTLAHVFKMAHATTFAYPEGSTLSLAFLPNGEKYAHIAVLGDSPVIAERANGEVFVAPQHNVRSNLAERALAVSRGAVYFQGYVWNAPYSFDNSKGLQMSRALGDYALDSFLVREPEIMTIELGSFLLVGSDGLLDPTHTQLSNQILFEYLRVGATAGQLVQRAVDVPTNDNATAVLWRRE